MTDEDLTPEQRAWRPQRLEDLYFGVLHWRVEVWSETLPDGTQTPSALQIENGSGPHWDWRTVAYWRHALPPSWRIWLATPARIALIRPSRATCGATTRTGRGRPSEPLGCPAHSCALAAGQGPWRHAQMTSQGHARGVGMRRVEPLLSRRALLGGGLVAAVGPALLGVPPAVAATGTVLSWGSNGAGQLGRGKTSDILRAGPVSGLPDIVEIGAADDASFAIDAAGQVWSWGNPDVLGRTSSSGLRPGRILGLSGITSVVGSLDHALARRSDGAVFAWGHNEFGQLGDGHRARQHPLPLQVAGLPPASVVAVGPNFSAAVTEDGSVYTWGLNDGNALGLAGLGVTEPGGSFPSPVLVPGISTATRLTIGNRHVLVLLADGSLIAWGFNDHGQLGRGSRFPNSGYPRPVRGSLRFRAVAAARYSSIAVTRDGRVAQWGFAGTTADPERTVAEPVLRDDLSDVIGVTSDHADSGLIHFARRAGGGVFAYGGNSAGQLGDPTRPGSLDWVRVPGVTAARRTAGGSQHGLALT